MADPDHIVIWAWAAALVCVAPSTLVLVPGLYILGSLAWNISEHFTIRWLVAWAYMACFGAAAALNVVLLRWIAGQRSLRRTRRA